MKKGLCAAVLAAAIMLTGCTSVPDLSRLNNDMEAEYIAGTLLKYDANYDKMLEYDRSVLNPTPIPSPTATPLSTAAASKMPSNASSQGSISQPEEYVSLDKISPAKGIQIKQESYELKKSYGSDYDNVSAKKGKQLFIVKFCIKNSSSTKKKVNMVGKKMSYSLEINGNNIGQPMITILERDMQYFNTSIPAGKSREAILVFSVDVSQKISNTKLYVSDGKQTAQISLK